MATTYDETTDETEACAQAARKELGDVPVVRADIATPSDPPVVAVNGGVSKGGAPAGNTNRATHYLRCQHRHGMVLGTLPEDCDHIKRSLSRIRNALEAAVMEAKGEISIPDAASIITVLRWERHAALALRWMTKEYVMLNVDQRLTLSRDIARASSERDKALASLRLDKSQRDIWDTITLPPAPNAAEPSQEPQ